MWVESGVLWIYIYIFSENGIAQSLGSLSRCISWDMNERMNRCDKHCHDSKFGWMRSSMLPESGSFDGAPIILHKSRFRRFAFSSASSGWSKWAGQEGWWCSAVSWTFLVIFSPFAFSIVDFVCVPPKILDIIQWKRYTRIESMRCVVVLSMRSLQWIYNNAESPIICLTKTRNQPERFKRT